jgi:hypothetical protein
VYRSVSELPAQYTALRGRFDERVVYAEHPADPEHFVPLAVFHPHLVQEKRAELTRLAASLGAREIRLVDSSRRDRASSGSGDGVVPVRGVPVDVKAGGGSRAATSETFSLSARMPKPTHAPSVPEGLRWLSHEPLWQAMAETRLRQRAISFEVQFRYAHDFGVDGRLAAKLAGFGLSAGGSFSEMERIEQEYEVEFHPVE